MGFSGYTTVLTTGGVKTLKDLENKPFTAVINENWFPCHYGSHKLKDSDLYFVKTTGGHSVLTTINQRFLTEKGTFREIQDFRYGDKLVLSIPTNYNFDGISPEHYDLDTIDPKYEFYDASFYKLFFRNLFNTYGKFTENGLSFYFGIQSHSECNLIVRMFARFGIISGTISARRNMIGVIITNRNLLNYVTHVGFDNTQDENLAYEHLIEKPPSDIHMTTFRSLTYQDTQMAYSCEIEGAKAFDANCFYVHDLTLY